MIKTYVDWNVMSGMKNGNFPELQEILRNKNKFLLLYSTAHIGDIRASISNVYEQEQYVIDDLDYISELTDGYCISNDLKNISIGQCDPGGILDDLIQTETLFDDFSIDNLFRPIEGDEIANAMMQMVKNMLKAIPMDAMLKQAYEHEESAKMMDKMFPGLRDDMSMDGFFKAFARMYKNLNETEDYKELRDTIQTVGINSGHFSPGKNPFELIETAYENKGMGKFTANQYFDKTKNAPEWFNEITGEYLNLDMHGFKADKIKVNAKEKSTFKNTTDDASHTAFASRCEIYITNDDRNYHKTKAVYEKLQIFTKVFKPDEFVDYYRNFLDFHTFEEHYDSMLEVMRDGQHFRDWQNVDGSYFGTVAYPPHYFFNFFNKIMIPDSPESPYFLLGKDSSANAYIITLREIEFMANLFIEQYGADIDGKTTFDCNELNGDQWGGRRWRLTFGDLQLKRLNGWFQLYFYIETPKPEQETKKKRAIARFIENLRNFFKRP